LSVSQIHATQNHVLFYFKSLLKGLKVMFSELSNASFVLVGAALTFLPIERQIVVKLMLAHKQNKG